MEDFDFPSAVRGYHIYQDVWKPSMGESLVVEREHNNPMDKFTVKVMRKGETVGHLPHEFSKISWYFLARGGSINVEVTGRRQHCKKLCGGMEVPCLFKFSSSSKTTIGHLKEVLKNTYLIES